MSGILITFEGIDLCGKSVQIERLVEKLKAQHLHFTLLREPGGTVFSEKIREVLLAKNQEAMCAATEYLLFSAARAQIVQKKILPALAQGFIVICDRYFDSSTAYQGYGRGIDLLMIEKINDFATKGIKPNLTFLIDIDLDDQTKEFFHKVRDGYLAIAAQNQERFVVIDGKRSVDIIAEDIWREVKELLQKNEY
jgi:dTMP kinase